MKLWVTGATGLFGSNFIQQMRGRYERVWGIARHPGRAGDCEWLGLDLADGRAVEEALGRTRPDAVLHAAALADVDRCEREPETARAQNIEVPVRLARWCGENGARLAFLSTDSVYAETDEAKAEEARLAPLNVYAQSKLEAEERIRGLCPVNHVILRTNFFGWSPRPGVQLAEWIAATLRAGKTVPGFGDVRFSPLLANDLAEQVAGLLEKNASGTFNAGGAGGCSKYEFARGVAEALGHDPDQVEERSIGSVAFPARRPRNMVMDSSKMARVSGLPLAGWREGLRAWAELEKQGWRERVASMAGAAA
jgi:dTDP-4-dehydrorhamnose reductase